MGGHGLVRQRPGSPAGVRPRGAPSIAYSPDTRGRSTDSRCRRWRRVIDASRTGHAGSCLDRSPRRDRGRGHTASLQWAPQGKATVLDVRPTESPLTCLPRSGLSSAHVSSRTRACNRNKSPHVSRLRGRRSQRRGEVGSWGCERCRRTSGSVIAEVAQRQADPFFFRRKHGGCGQSAVHNMTAIDNRFPQPRPLLGGGAVDRWPSKPRVAGSNPAGRAIFLKNSLIVREIGILELPAPPARPVTSHRRLAC